ncbi:uncharacterized protein LOC122042570 [Zingiber officinale]|uniref:CAAX prenyl protease 2/Lysostaphin resistance protein A-like domain-containing protein n=1 Tax=Zingiber officinale TaxID=94328 RepID=A0A8J5LQC6_ZINOF|nr:uncharacterized protein LOC122042570 [Zingiber officinale]KAG6529625.1 hypothetical protein ZIOFF_011837 [Zingiber officinale]
MSAACRSLALPPLTPLPSPSRARSSLRTVSSLPSTFGRSLSACRAPRKGWKTARVSCFMHEEDEEETSSSKREFDFVEVKQGGEVGETRLEESGKEKAGWILRIGKVLTRIFTLNGNGWTVPWTLETIVQVMLLWIASFWFVGSWIIPFLAHAAGFSKESLTHRGQALYSLLTDVAEGLAGIAILHRCLSRFQPLPSGWFQFNIKGKSWHLDVGLGCLLFPLVNLLSQINISMVPALPAPPVGVSSVEQSILARDPVAMVIYAIVVSVCAPVWEEIVFRGFLLPSLTRYMPLWGSILVSAVAFALAHFNAQRLLPLVFLGVVMGVVFARSKNLLPPILLHSLWNGFVFLDLMK